MGGGCGLGGGVCWVGGGGGGGWSVSAYDFLLFLPPFLSATSNNQRSPL